MPSFICWEKKAFLFPRNMSQHKRQQSRRPYWKKNFLRHHISYKIMVVGYPKNLTNRAGRLLCSRLCFDLFLAWIKKPYNWKKHFLRVHIYSKNMVVDYLKIKNHNILSGRLLCCRWCLDIFLGYKETFFAQHMSDGKVDGLIEKALFETSHLL